MSYLKSKTLFCMIILAVGFLPKDSFTIKPQNKNLILYGSSTLSYLSDELEDLAIRKKLSLKNHAFHGDTTYGAAQAQGSNKVTLQFKIGLIKSDRAQPVIVSASFGEPSRNSRLIELNNGVNGILYPNSTFKPLNLNSDLIVFPTEKFRAIEPKWFNLKDGIYIFNIGKNNVSDKFDNAEEIFQQTVKMIEYIPSNSKFIVGGHFSNTNSNENHHKVVESLNSKLKAKYGIQYFDINELLFSELTWKELKLTKTLSDISAIKERRKPPSLSRDSGHLSEAMDIIVAKEIEHKLIQLRYIE